jgi:hypothetical protein
MEINYPRVAHKTLPPRPLRESLHGMRVPQPVTAILPHTMAKHSITLRFYSNYNRAVYAHVYSNR